MLAIVLIIKYLFALLKAGIIAVSEVLVLLSTDMVTKSDKHNPALRLIITDDGSHSIRNDTLDEIYHSTAGAVQESLHVYIKAGYDEVDNEIEELNILEVGFGTGLNAWLTLLKCRQQKRKVNYVCLEPEPIPARIFSKLNYPDFEKCRGDKALFLKLHESPVDTSVVIHAYFTLLKDKCRIENFNQRKPLFDLVYFDAFAPDIQAELWTLEIFNNLFSMMKSKGILVTYSAKGAVRRNLQSAGFLIERIPGPPGKREMLRARKK